jgi:hypothetical protein
VIHTFIWGGATTALIAKKTLYCGTGNGGINLLNIKAWNDAINIMWLKEYLNMSPIRPTWAYIVDILLCESAPSQIPNEIRSSPFLQTWNAPIKGKRAEFLDQDTIQLLKTAKTVNLQFTLLQISH